MAGRLLAPYLGSRVDPTLVDEEMLDLQADAGRDAEYAEALELALRWADLDAAAGDYRRALHWLEVAEGLNLVVPEAYRDKRKCSPILEGSNLIGLIGSKLHPLSHVVQSMRGTVQTSQYIQQMGPFFVGRAIGRHPGPQK